MDLLKQLIEICEEKNVKEKELLSKHSTFRIGGPADYFISPKNYEDLSSLLVFCDENKIPYYILGNGSNILFGDKGFRGVMIKIGSQLSKTRWVNEKTVIAESGILLSKLAMEIANNGLTGFEFAAGIPGTLGGAVTMNAGAYGGEIKDCIDSAIIMDAHGICKTLKKEELQLGYRTSIIQKTGAIVLEAAFSFESGEREKIKETITDLNQRRKEKQPLEFPSAGSTFKRPEGYFAGKLITDAGLKGYRLGNVMVSDKHAGFVINTGNGTAKEVMELIQYVTEEVKRQYSVVLEPEIRIVGEL